MQLSEAETVESLWIRIYLRIHRDGLCWHTNCGSRWNQETISHRVVPGDNALKGDCKLSVYMHGSHEERDKRAEEQRIETLAFLHETIHLH